MTDPEARWSARERSGGYLLLADLLEWGPTPRLRDAAELSPILARAMARVESQDELDASHTSAFGLQVFPCAGLFLHPTAQAGAGAARLRAHFRELGFDPESGGPGVDHLATALRALGHASAREAEAIGEAGAEAIRVHVRRLFDGHLLRWLPAWESAVRRLGETWPSALATQILELALYHRSGLGPCDEKPTPLPPLLDLEAPDTDLRAIAAALTTPAIAGLFLSGTDIRELARGARAPTGFGPRAVVLENTLQSAARYDALADVIDRLRGLYRSWAKELETACAQAVPGLEEAVQPWRKRTREMTALLDRFGVAARNAAA